MLSYIGGKSKIGKWINDYYPVDMEIYVETFGGMFWCFFNMDLSKYPNLKKVVYNDFNPLNYNLFQCVKKLLIQYLVNKLERKIHRQFTKNNLIVFNRKYLVVGLQ